ncbi:MAG TPA: hypothetical protein PLV23_08150 [Sedimentibacter sp.]|nr:hypothetical protein [Sedimentibacter sp.]HOW23589.1 hypothetical protein [Sedimentibacter sp.]
METVISGIKAVFGSELKINKIFLVIGLLYCLLLIVVGFFEMAYSKTRNELNLIKDSVFLNQKQNSEIFTREDISHLPYPVKKYFDYCGFLNKPKMYSMKAVFKDVKFLFDKGKTTLTIDYLQYNKVKEPARIAYIHSYKYGVPFEGLDSYIGGKGSMKGVLAKIFTLFNQTGENMNKACLVTFLSECLLVPNAALQDYITWEEIDHLHAKTVINYFGMEVQGIFTFNEKGELISFTTNDREAISSDGKSEKVRWTAVLGEYEEKEGIKRPTRLQAIWHYDDGDLLYFDGKGVIIEYDPAD